VTQANASTSHDGTSGQSDEAEDLTVKRVPLPRIAKPRIRSNSLSINVQGRLERGETLGIFKTVQIHARSRHVFASDNSKTAQPIDVIAPLSTFILPVPARRNSTSASSHALGKSGEPLLSSSPPLVPESLSPLDPATPQSTSPPQTLSDLEIGGEKLRSLDYLALEAARDSQDHAKVMKEVQTFRLTAVSPTVTEFNIALEALRKVRREGEPPIVLLETYNDMISRSIYPNIKTYTTLISSLTDRDLEIHKAVKSYERRSKLFVKSEPMQMLNDKHRTVVMQQENNFSSAVSLFETAAATIGNHKIPLVVYRKLIRSAACHSNVDVVLNVFARLEKRRDLLPPPSIYVDMINVYANVGDTAGAKQVFDEFQEASREGRIAWDTDTLISTSSVHPAPRAQVTVWNCVVGNPIRVEPSWAHSLFLYR